MFKTIYAVPTSSAKHSQGNVQITGSQATGADGLCSSCGVDPGVIIKIFICKFFA